MKKALIVVDYQKDFVDGALGFEGAQNPDAHICEEIQRMRQSGGDVLFTYDTHGADYLQTAEGRFLPIAHCIKNTDGWQLYGKTAEMVDSRSIGFEKSTFGSFELAAYLKSVGYDDITLVGLVSSICVLSNAVLARAALPQATIRIIEKATAAPDPADHAAAMRLLRGMGFSVE